MRIFFIVKISVSTMIIKMIVTQNFYQSFYVLMTSKIVFHNSQVENHWYT